MKIQTTFKNVNIDIWDYNLSDKNKIKYIDGLCWLSSKEEVDPPNQKEIKRIEAFCFVGKIIYPRKKAIKHLKREQNINCCWMWSVVGRNTWDVGKKRVLLKDNFRGKSILKPELKCYHLRIKIRPSQICKQVSRQLWWPTLNPNHH